MTRPSISYKVSDTHPRFEDVLADNPGHEQPLDLTTWDNPTVKLYVQHVDSGTMVVNDTATIDDHESGKVSYTFSASQTANTGTHRAEWVVEGANGATQTVPSAAFRIIEIDQALDRNTSPSTADQDITVTAVYTDELRVNTASGIGVYNDLLTAAGAQIYDATAEAIPGSALGAVDLADLRNKPHSALDDAPADAHHSRPTTGAGIVDNLGTFELDVIADDIVQLTDGRATVPTGVTTSGANINAYLDPSGDGQNTVTVKVAGRAVWDGTEYKIEIIEDGTNVNNPYVGYKIVRA